MCILCNLMIKITSIRCFIVNLVFELFMVMRNLTVNEGTGDLLRVNVFCRKSKYYSDKGSKV